MQETGAAVAPARAAEQPPQTAEQQTQVEQKTVLYVGDLDQQVTEPELADAFQRNGGGVSSVRLCRDLSTGRSLSYAYINFTSHDHASKALEWMNYTKLREKPMRIMWSQRDPHCRKTGIGNVFVKNLQPSITSARLQCIFCAYGTVLSCKVAAEDNGKSKGFGFAQFESEDSAIAAVEALHGTILEGKKLYVSKFVRKSERKSTGGGETKFTNVYVKNLSKELTEAQVIKKFEELGKVTSVLLAKDDAGNPKGFGFINYEKPEDAKNAIDKLNGETTLGVRSLFVGRAQKKSEREQVVRYKEANLYVKNIDKTVDEQALKNFFSSCGSVSSVKIMRHDNGEGKGFGFVSLTTPDEAKKAISTLNGKMMGGRRITVAVAMRKEERPVAGRDSGSKPPPGFQYHNYFLPSFPQPSYDPYMYRRHLYTGPTAEAFYPISSHCYQQNLPNYWLGGGYGGGDVLGGGLAGTTMATNGIIKGRKNNNNNKGEKKIGEKLFQLVCKIEPEKAAKVTGMLMEMNKGEVTRAISSPNYLASKVSKAVEILNASSSSSSTPPPCAKPFLHLPPSSPFC